MITKILQAEWFPRAVVLLYAGTAAWALGAVWWCCWLTEPQRLQRLQHLTQFLRSYL